MHLDRSVIHEQGEAYDKSGCITSTLNVAKGNRKPLDLYLAETKAEDGVQQNVGFLHICKFDFYVNILLFQQWSESQYGLGSEVKVIKIKKTLF